LGVDNETAEVMVLRYGRQARRLQLDLKQEHRRRLLAIEQTLEADLLEVLHPGDPQWAAIDDMVRALLPAPGELSAVLEPPGGPSLVPQPGRSIVVNQTVNQQFIDRVAGAVVQGVQGSLSLSPEAVELLSIIQAEAGESVPVLESAVHTLEDPEARPSDRETARGRIRRFLEGAGSRVGDAAIDVLRAYVESKTVG
jgi:hypothetical protein